MVSSSAPEVLWLSRTGLRELCGMSALPALQELYASFNEIDDLGPLSYHDALQVGPQAAFKNRALALVERLGRLCVS